MQCTLGLAEEATKLRKRLSEMEDAAHSKVSDPAKSPATLSKKKRTYKDFEFKQDCREIER